MASSDDTHTIDRHRHDSGFAARPSRSPSSRERLAWLMRHAEQDIHAESPSERNPVERGRGGLLARRRDVATEETSFTAPNELNPMRMRPGPSQAGAENPSFRPQPHWGVSIKRPQDFFQGQLDSPAMSDRSWSTTRSSSLSVAMRPSEEQQLTSENSSISSTKSIAGSDTEELVATSTTPKTSRYLREIDRRVILERLERGEKQSALAKEFMVSRAAICNLNKHRHEVLARSGGNPFAKHPKKKKKKLVLPQRATVTTLTNSTTRPPSASTLSTLSASSPSMATLPGVNKSSSGTGTLHVVCSKALQLLLSAMGDQTSLLADFRRTTERALWLLMEEALAFVPIDECVSLHQSEVESSFPCFTAASPPAAVSMEHQAMGATPMLDIFRLMEPRQPSGGVTVLTDDQNNLYVDVLNLDGSLRGHDVFLLNVVAASGEAVRATIEQLIQRFGAAEDCISVVSLFTSSEVVAMVQCKYPRARIVTARIDSSITRRRVASTLVDLILQRMRQAL